MSLSKRTVSCIVSALLVLLTPLIGTQAQTTSSPRIFYSDLESGPSTGGQGGEGAFVTIYGRGFGASQGTSTVTIGGIAAHKYMIWSDTRVSFQLNSTTVTGNIIMNVGGVGSNGVPFTVRAGRIHFVSMSGNDAQKGNFNRPWRTLTKAKASSAPGDIIYLMNGFSAAAQDSLGASLAITRAGSNGSPFALVAYPGATATIGSATGQAYGVKVPSGDLGNWVLAGLTLRGASEAIDVTGTSNWRLVGNDISCPNGSGSGACVHTSSTSQIKFLGNKVHDSGSPTGSSLVNYESVQFSEGNTIEAGWNQVGNTLGCSALVFSSAGSAESGLLVHDNYIDNAVCDGISFSGVNPSQGAVVAYNNIVEHVGVGPAPAGGESTYACINASGSNAGTVQILNNTFYDCGARANADSGGIAATVPVILTNNIFSLVAGESYVTPNTHTSVLTGSNNLFWGAGAVPAPFSSSLDADPLFIDIANANFHLQPSSPAIDAGGKSGVATDYDGVSRPQGAADDIGAYESAGTVQASGQLAENPNALNFGTVTIAASSTQSVVVSNAGTASVTISQMKVTGSSFSANGLSVPATLAPGQSMSFTVTFTPLTAGSVTGSVALLSNAANATSTVQLSGTGASAPPPNCSTSTTLWQSTSYAAQSGTFTAQWDASPSAQGIGAFMGLSASAATTWNDNAAMVRFNVDNTIQALKGGNPDVYAADTMIPYTAGSSYHFRLVLNVTNHSYSAFVTPSGGTEILLASNYPFLSNQQTVATLGSVNTIWETLGGATFCNFAITPTAGTLSATPGSVNFGSVIVGSSATQNVTVTANTSSVTVSQATASAGFGMSGPTLPMTLAAGQSATFQVKFAPTTTGSMTGTLSLASNGSSSPTVISLSGTGAIATGTLSAAPASLSLGNVTVGSSATQNVTVTASTNSVSITQASAATGFSVSGLTLPMTLAAGQSATFQVKFAPTAAGSVAGSLSLTSNASNSPTAIALSGTGVSAPPAGCSASTSSWQSTSYAAQSGTFTAQWDASPSAQGIGAFMGLSASAATTWNDNAAMVRFNVDNTIQALKGGNPDVYAADTTIPYTAGNSYHFRLVLSVPNHSYSAFVTPPGGTEILLASNYPFLSNQQTIASLGSVNIIWETLSGATFCNFAIMPTAGGLSATPGSVNFGSVIVGSSATQNVTVTANTSSVTVSQATVSAGFGMSGPTLPMTLAVGQSATFQVKFAPTATGSVTGSLSLTSSASGSPAVISITGTGTTATHSATLNWDASTSTGVVGYYVYRGTQSGGPYTKLTTTAVTGTTYTDSGVTAGTAYFYVVDAVASDGTESVHSGEVSATIPTP